MAETEPAAEPARARFDGAAAWAALPPGAQARIGALALALVAVWYRIDREGPGPVSADAADPDGAIWAAEDRVSAALDRAVTDALPEGAFGGAAGRTPPIPSGIAGVGPSCRCARNEAGEEGCCWAAEDLYAACAPGAVP